MSIPIGGVILTPGIQKQVSLINIPNVSALKVTNGTPFDITYSGFGVQGSSIIPAGLEYMLYSHIQNAGYINLLAVNNAGVSGNGVVNIVIFDTGEQLPPGVWPVSVPTQTVSATVSTVQTLSNEGNTVGSLVIDIGPTGNGNIVQIWNDHFIWSVLQSGVLHQVIQGETSGNPLQLGQPGDIVQILCSLLVDTNLTVTGNITTNTIKDSGGNNWAAVTAGTNTRIANPVQVTLQINGGNVVVANATGAQVFGTLSTSGDASIGGNLLGNPIFSYSAGTGAQIGENATTANGFAIGRNGGNSTNVIASYNASGGIGFKVGGMAGTKVFESKVSRDFIIQGGTYYTNQTTFNFSANGSFDGFDFGEYFPVAEEYHDGTVVCPGVDGLMHVCTHFNCDKASIISIKPAFCAGSGEGVLSQPLALCGRKIVQCNTDIPFGEHVYSNGDGTVASNLCYFKYSVVNSLGYTISEPYDGCVGIMVRYQQIRIQ